MTRMNSAEKRLTQGEKMPRKRMNRVGLSSPVGVENVGREEKEERKREERPMSDRGRDMAIVGWEGNEREARSTLVMRSQRAGEVGRSIDGERTNRM